MSLFWLGEKSERVEFRFGKGRVYRPAKYPDQPLTFWAFESSPFSRFVRECLVELVPSHSFLTLFLTVVIIDR